MGMQQGMQQNMAAGMQAMQASGGGRSAPPVGYPYMDANAAHSYGYMEAAASAQQAQMLAHSAQSSGPQGIPLSASFEARPHNAHSQHVPYDALGRSFDDLSKQQGLMSPHRVNTRSSFNGSGKVIDGAPPVLPDAFLDINGQPINPSCRDYPRAMIQTGACVLTYALLVGQSGRLPISSMALPSPHPAHRHQQ